MQLRRSTRNDGGRKAYTFQWKVENISYSWMERREYLESPTFIANALEGTKWSLRLFPKRNIFTNSFNACLYRENDWCGPEVIQVKYDLALLDEDGLISETEGVDEFRRNYIGSQTIYGKLRDLFSTERNTFFPEDTITIRCNMWTEEVKPAVSERLPARTAFQGQRGSFVWRIDKFSTLSSGLISNFVVINELEDVLINFDLVLRNATDLYIDIRSRVKCIKFYAFKASIIDWKGKKAECGSTECCDGDGDVEEGIVSSIRIKQFPLESGLYLRNDVLSLDCEYIFSTGTVFSEYPSCGTISSSVSREVNKKRQPIPDLQDDLKSMYSDAIFCDVELRTSTEKFPAHKAILSARSSVFRRMLSSDMKEKSSGHVDITDLDAETVHRMLTYVYTDSLGDLQMKSAPKLYTAADKYDIPSLKRKCSDFMQDNMRPNTVCDVLVLADMHQDHYLKSAAQDYIQDHDEVVLRSQEWKHLMDTNLQLAANVMYRKFSKPMKR
ncbi:TD and POZ domain-containing protein 5, partial [Araneus ventricosus]